MRCVTWPVGTGPKIWKPWPRFAYSLYNFKGATMIIKGSLLCSVPIVKPFGRKFISPKMGRNFEVFWVFREKILTLTIRPPGKSIPTETRNLAQKRCWSVQNRYLQQRARNSIKIKKINPSWPSHFTHLPARPCGDDLYHFWLVVSYRRRNHPCEILSRLVKGLEGHGAPKSGVSHWLWMSLLQQCYSLTCYTVIDSDIWHVWLWFYGISSTQIVAISCWHSKLLPSLFLVYCLFAG